MAYRESRGVAWHYGSIVSSQCDDQGLHGTIITGTKGRHLVAKFFQGTIAVSRLCDATQYGSFISCISHYYIDCVIRRRIGKYNKKKAILGARHACKLALRVSLRVSKVYSRS
jgi:hypothetical protein